MNSLLQITKAEILERQTFSANAFPDNHLLAAIEAYDIEGSKNVVLEVLCQCQLRLQIGRQSLFLPSEAS